MVTVGEKSWVMDVTNKMEVMTPSLEPELWKKLSVYRVPSYTRDLNPKAYKPQVVSLGPYHHGDPDLLSMEEHKHRALLHFLKRSGKPFKEFVAAMEEIVQLLQDSYQNLGAEFSDRDRFMQLMVIDGCFMLEVFRASEQASNDYASNDTVFSSKGMLHASPYLRRDMLMIENQLPLIVMKTLVAVETGKSMNEEQLNKTVLKFCAPNAQPPTPGIGLGLHALDLFRRSLLQGPQVQSRVLSEEPVLSEIIIRSALELYVFGIRFQKSQSNGLLDIRFCPGFRHHVLSLPLMVVDEATEYIYLNLLAFERLHMDAGNEVTSYIFFMASLIGSAMDVNHLDSRGVVLNLLRSDEAVLKLFKSLSKDVVLDQKSSLNDVRRDIAVHVTSSWRSTKWNHWRANLVNAYFRSPWTILSLAAAIFLLGLTVVQTVYTVYPYYNPRRQL